MSTDRRDRIERRIQEERERQDRLRRLEAHAMLVGLSGIALAWTLAWFAGKTWKALAALAWAFGA